MSRRPTCRPWLLVLWCIAVGQVASAEWAAAGHPRLLLGAGETAALRDEWPKSNLFAAAVARAEARLAPYLNDPPDVPVPRDAGGGGTHERHKANAVLLADAGALHQWTGEARYAELARQLLLRYAELYPGLGLHPERSSGTPGRLFWQSLNESVWLVHAILGYDCIRDALDADERRRIENDLLRPMARFLSIDSPRMFNSVHNHGTWAAAAVGMTGYVLDDERLVRMALLGTGEDGNGGYLLQLAQLFSPQGYYLEGPYYQRYALMPFVLFAKAIDRNEPARGIFAHRDGVLLKAIHTTIQLSYAERFFPINDAIREKGLDTMELDHAIAIAHGHTANPALLSLVDERSHLVLSADALRLALAKEAGAEQPFPYASQHYRDGPAGDQGALTVLRSGPGPEHSALVFKATSHGLGHGHFDRLHWMFYDNGAEIVADYGAVRFLNVVQKAGGRYLQENLSWAKQTVAHNTLVVNGQSQFQANVEEADASWPTDHFHEARAGAQIVSAVEDRAYPGVELRRTMLLVDWPALEQPVVLDVWRARSVEAARFDLPLHFKGQLIESVPVLSAMPVWRELGEGEGYRHLWLVGDAALPAGTRWAFTWLQGRRFYTYSVFANVDGRAHLARLGAGDPNFNLRPESALLLRTAAAKELSLVAVLEPHGEYDAAREFTRGSVPRIAAVLRASAAGKDVITVIGPDGAQLQVALSYQRDPDLRHVVEAEGGRFEWRGYYQVSMTDAISPKEES